MGARQTSFVEVREDLEEGQDKVLGFGCEGSLELETKVGGKKTAGL
jgi:hypothetical protein